MRDEPSTTKDVAARLRDAPQVRAGGRSARVASDVLRAATEILVEDGAGKLTFERVAERAGVNRGTLYRRWKSRPRLIAWAMIELLGEIAEHPDTGSVEGDLVEFALRLAALDDAPLGDAFLEIFVVEARRDAAVREAVAEFWKQRLETGRQTVLRGIERGELAADTDPTLFIEQAFGPLFYRVFRNESLTRDAVTYFVRQAIAAHGPTRTGTKRRG